MRSCCGTVRRTQCKRLAAARQLQRTLGVCGARQTA